MGGSNNSKIEILHYQNYTFESVEITFQNSRTIKQIFRNTLIQAPFNACAS